MEFHSTKRVPISKMLIPSGLLTLVWFLVLLYRIMPDITPD